MAHTLWVMELRLIISTIYQSNFPVANLVLELHRVLVDDYDAIVGSVGDDDQISVEAGLLLDADDFTGVAQVLATCSSLLIAFTDGLVNALCFDLIGLLFLRLPSDRSGMVQSLIVKVIGHR